MSNNTVAVLVAAASLAAIFPGTAPPVQLLGSAQLPVPTVPWPFHSMPAGVGVANPKETDSGEVEEICWIKLPKLPAAVENSSTAWDSNAATQRSPCLSKAKPVGAIIPAI